MKHTTSENAAVGRVTWVKFFFVCGSAGGHVSGRGEFLAMSTGFFPRVRLDLRDLHCTVEEESHGKRRQLAAIGGDWPQSDLAGQSRT